MNRPTYIAASNMYPRLPIWPSLTAYLALEHFQAPMWAYGAVGMLMGLLWIGVLLKLATGKSVDLLGGK